MQIPLWQEQWLTMYGGNEKHLNWTCNDRLAWMMDLGVTVMICTLHVVILKQAYITQGFISSWLYSDLWIQLSEIHREEFRGVSILVPSPLSNFTWAPNIFIASFHKPRGRRNISQDLFSYLPLCVNYMVAQIFFINSISSSSEFKILLTPLSVTNW